MIMAKTANLYARIEPELKEQAESILTELGIPASNAITMFYKQIILQRGIPFEVKLPNAKPLGLDGLTKEQIDAALQEGYDDALAGCTKPAEEVFASIRRDYGL
jgi:DNA-damage-inducible protein J